jgi:uncharacterized membrane protein YdjX (TVP38/TMEM64 family)
MQERRRTVWAWDWWRWPLVVLLLGIPVGVLFGPIPLFVLAIHGVVVSTTTVYLHLRKRGRAGRDRPPAQSSSLSS